MNHFVDIDLNKTCGIGPGIAFANAVESLGGSSKFGFMGLVPCAVGGTKISQWERGTNLYNQLITRAKAATLGGGRTRAVLWYQGEADTVKLEDAKAYRGRMENFISDLRSDLGDPSLLIIQTYARVLREAESYIEAADFCSLTKSEEPAKGAEKKPSSQQNSTNKKKERNNKRKEVWVADCQQTMSKTAKTYEP
ncbi:probable carbohydrate esterase At4g34215 [Chenopodium quinoa]|uniref:probable carbohydrate esterase At4g34215 n=1 Tax=Chenopodium quinoa TaxID=63459 RepID=UPI000B781889|nr:probable carbohydrate esterase At4g34215 [Chenopodium quinoa]